MSVAAFETIHQAFAAWHQSRTRCAGSPAIMIALVCVLVGVPVASGAPLTPFPVYVKPVCSAGDGSGFGWGFRFDLNREGFHPGLDFDVEPGFPVYAAGEGTVISAGARGPYGLAVDIDHGRGHRTRYGHLAMLAVSAGQRVPQGATIGWSGATGLTTKPVLHFEVWRNDVVHDPGVRIGPNWRCLMKD